jgi:anti-sigma B factor antagonist
MSIGFQDIGASLRRITISGRLDMEGTDAISVRLMELVEEPKMNVVLDISAVRFLASVGIRALIASAKAVQGRGGKLVILVGAGSSVAMSLEATGLNDLVPVFTNSTQAEEAAAA